MPKYTMEEIKSIEKQLVSNGYIKIYECKNFEIFCREDNKSHIRIINFRSDIPLDNQEAKRG